MRAQLWPGCEFWYQVSLLGILLLPYAYYRFILVFGGEKSGIAGRIYFVGHADLLLAECTIWSFP